MSKAIDNILAGMRKQGKLQNMKGKGDAGEDAVLNLCLDLQSQIGGLLYQSYKYPYQTKRDGQIRLGNIKLENGKYVDYTETKRALSDEIDLLFVTPYRIFAIEVKSYHARLKLYDHWVDQNNIPVEKSPIAQAEKHARHLYKVVSSVIPFGDPKYIVPMCCFVDRCDLKDMRSEEMKYYIPVSILNNFKSKFVSHNTPLEYNLDTSAIKRRLDADRESVRKEFV